MSKRKQKFIPRRSLASGVSMSESLLRPDAFANFWSPQHRQTLYTINVSGNMLAFIEKMARDPAFRQKVEKLL